MKSRKKFLFYPSETTLFAIDLELANSRGLKIPKG